MKSDRKANLLVFLTIAIVALGLSSISAAFTGDLFTNSLPGMNSSDKMIALDDDGFSPNAVSTYKEEVEVKALLQLLILILVIIHPIQKAMTAILKTKSLVLFITSILFL